ncbi:hypothetical protein DH2020_003052 [Rehmannia glutinosa]|uniref:Uncharacterized protein n=1 Tax=Rehmannia glutinosa TaxID=99300 RepID=A0ABR0XKJ4_REHGL
MKKNHQSGSAEEWDDDDEEEEEEEEEEEQISDYDGSEDEKCRKTRKRSEGKKSSKQTPMKFNKKEFIGWASRSLIDFLTSIGKNTGENLSQHDVTSIVNEYVKENKLINPEKKRMIMCDARLKSLFRKRTISKYRVYDLLEDHFAENHDESEEDEVGYDSEDNNAGILNACKRQRKLDMEEKSVKKDLDNIVRDSCFAAIVVENVKLVYLKRSMLEELLKQPESFEEKVTGCFVRVKRDPYDCRSRISHQLMQVKGVRTVPAGEDNTGTVLLVSAIPKEIQIRLVSDADFLEEECDDLRQRVLAGELERPTVADLQQKAKVLHKDITKNHVMAFLVCDFNYNASTLFEYLEKRKILQSPSGQARLLENVPTVIPDIIEPDSNSGGSRNDIKSDEGSPQSILPCNSSEENTQHCHASPSERKQPISEKSTSKQPQLGDTPDSEPEHDNINLRKLLQLSAKAKRNRLEVGESVTCSQQMHDKHAKTKGHEGSKIELIDLLSDDEDDNDSKASNDLENEKWCYRGPNGELGRSSLSVLKLWSEKSRYAFEFKAWKEDQNEENVIPLREALRIALRKK